MCTKVLIRPSEDKKSQSKKKVKAQSKLAHDCQTAHPVTNTIISNGSTIGNSSMDMSPTVANPPSETSGIIHFWQICEKIDCLTEENWKENNNRDGYVGDDSGDYGLQSLFQSL